MVNIQHDEARKICVANILGWHIPQITSTLKVGTEWVEHFFKHQQFLLHLPLGVGSSDSGDSGSCPLSCSSSLWIEYLFLWLNKINMPKQITDIKAFITTARKKDAKSVKIKRIKDRVKFKLRCTRYLHTLVLHDKEKAEKLKQSLPPGLQVKELKWRRKLCLNWNKF